VRQAEREAELPVWLELNDSLRAAGLLVATGRLHGESSATAVRTRGGKTEVTDGPFAVTKEVLVGFYLFRAAWVKDPDGNQLALTERLITTPAWSSA
jgi:hypothetical protein